MKKSKFTESQITGAIKAYEAGKDVSQGVFRDVLGIL